MIIDLSNLERIYDSGVVQERQGYSHTRIVKFPDKNSSRASSATLELAGRKLRTKIRHDQSYDFQSHYTVEVWNYSGGWQEVCTWIGGDVEVRDALPKWFGDKDRPKVETAVARMVEWMQETAVKVLS